MKSITTQALIHHALDRPENERAQIAEALIASLDSAPETDVEEAWQKEIERRLQEVDSGSIECIPWETVQKRLYENARSKS